MNTLVNYRTQARTYEKCSVCGRNTPYTFKDSISDREFYIPGSGQLCGQCYQELYEPDTLEIQRAIDSIMSENVMYGDFLQSENLVMPYNYAENEHYYVESLGVIPKKRIYSFFKRAFDIFVSVIALIVLAIPMLIIAAAIKLTSPGPVFYKQKRLGLNGKGFLILKFRSMRQDAEKSGARWSAGDDDDRITPIGHVLRKFRLDELPQLICTLVGSMTIVGPRPERECFYIKFEEHVHGFSERLKVKPGITGLAQVNGGYDLSPQEKVQLDIEYIKNRSVWADLVIMLKTVSIVFSHEGAK